MSYFFGLDSNYAGSFFNTYSGTGYSTNKTSGMSTILSDYASIRNGSYKKLLRAYYQTENDSSSGNSSISTSKDTGKKLVSIDDSAEALEKSYKELSNGAVFQKVSSKDEQGNTKRSYDSDKIYKSVKSYVDKYNDLMEVTEESNTTSIAKGMTSLISRTDANEKLLNSVGISVNSDFSLSIDEKKFKESDMATVKALFSGVGSYAYQISADAAKVSMYAENELQKSNTYSGNGAYSYNYMAGSLYDSYR